MGKRVYVEVTPKMMRWARESARMTLDVAAKKIGVTPEKLAEWEDGSAQPTVTQFRKAAHVYKRPSAAFLLEDVPQDFQIRRDFRRMKGRRIPEASSDLTFAIRDAGDLIETSIELAKSVGEPAKPSVVSATQNESVAEVAARIRESLGVSVQEQFKWPKDDYGALGNWRLAIESLGVLVIQFKGVLVEEARGFSIWSDEFPLVAVNGKDSPRARVFSMMHELAHLALRAEGLCDFVEGSSRTEKFCNAVAAEVLVPTDALLAEALVEAAGKRYAWPEDELLRLAKRYGVSREVILLRLVSVGKATHALYARKKAEYESVPPKEQSGAPPQHRLAVSRLGKPYVRLVLEAYYQKRISLRDVSDCLKLKVKQIPKVEAVILGGA